MVKIGEGWLEQSALVSQGEVANESNILQDTCKLDTKDRLSFSENFDSV
jgi:hypothetical protein